MVAALARDLRERSIDLAFAQVRGPVRDRLRRTGVMDAVGEGRIYASVAAAVDGLELEHALGSGAVPTPDPGGGGGPAR